MLEGNYQDNLTRLLAHVPTTVQLPDSWSGTEVSAALPTPVLNDRRRFPRSRTRTEAICEIIQGLAAIERPREFFKIHIKDVCRAGIGFLATFQLYPCEEVVLWTQTGRFRCKVTRCNKHNHKCFEVGTVFVIEPQRHDETTP
jgi:hypothetical protein